MTSAAASAVVWLLDVQATYAKRKEIVRILEEMYAYWE